MERKRIRVPLLELSGSHPDLKEVSEASEKHSEWHPVDTVNWPEYDYRPEVRFQIAHNNREIFIKYVVRERYVKAEKSKPNEMVCEDSCVEFFVSPNPDSGIYYNIEMNPIGTCLLGRGTGRADSRVMDPAVIRKIRRMGTLGGEPFQERTGDYAWELVLAIPLDVFGGNPLSGLSGRQFRANFYKCGDELTRMHFLSWNPVKTGRPDFHRPEYFGILDFE